MDLRGPAIGFERRSALYARLDARLCSRTRFFAAAALINTVLAELCELLPRIRSPRSFVFLDEIGTALEIVNLGYAREINGRTSPCHNLDHALVFAEQRRLQFFVQAHRTRESRQWESIRSELNALLNDRYAALLVSRWCKGTQRFLPVLREVRGHLGTRLDFAAESHRICIGVALIEYFRRDVRNP